jgi:sugar fermentation stimulation protein A
MRVWLEPNDDPRKKLKFGWRLVELEGGHFAGIDTVLPNRVVREALEAGAVPDLADYGTVRAEVPYGVSSRVDFLLTGDRRRDVYLEVKNAHLRRNSDVCEFPDCVTARGTKHLDELSAMVSDGHRAIMFYLVQRTDCSAFRLARDLDPAYGRAFDRARTAGVEVMCYDTRIDTSGVTLGSDLEVLE